MNSRQLFGVFIILVLAGSIIGAAIYSSNQNKEEQPKEQDVKNLKTDLSGMTYFESKENINANVKKILPVLIISADTNEFDISVIDSIINNLTGVRLLNSSFKVPQGKSITSSLVYDLEASFSSDLNHEFVFNLIKNATSSLLTNFSVAKKGIISFDKNVLLVNNDLNLSKEYVFSEPLSEAFLNFQTIEDDSIETKLFVNFNNGLLVKVLGQEIKNFNTLPQSHNVSSSVELLSLKNDFSFKSDFNYLNPVSEESLKDSLNEMDLNVISFSISLPEAILSVNISSPDDINSLKEDLNIIAIDFNSVLSFTPDNNSLKASFSLNDLNEIVLVKEVLTKKLNELGFSSFTFTEPKKSLNVSLKSKNNLTKELIDKINQLFEVNLIPLNYSFNAVIDSNNLFVDKNKSFNFSGDEVTASLHKFHSIGEKIPINGFFYSSRDNVVFYNFLETEFVEVS